MNGLQLQDDLQPTLTYPAALQDPSTRVRSAKIAAGLIHRDITPANVFAARRGGIHDVAKLLDFGLVRQLTSQQPRKPNTVPEGLFSGAPLYMSPEQATAYEDADARSDIYSLGAVAYYLLTSRPPFPGRSVLHVLAAYAVCVRPDPR